MRPTEWTMMMTAAVQTEFLLLKYLLLYSKIMILSG